MDLWTPVILGLLIGFVHYFGEHIDDYLEGYSFLLASFSAGFTISYFFITLLPETMSNSYTSVSNLFILLGFSSLYIVEEFVYTREEVFGEVNYEFKEVHTVLISVYHIVVGMLITFLASKSSEQLLLFYLPVLFHTGVNSLAVKEMNEEMLDKKGVKLFASFSTLIGVLFSFVVNLEEQTLYSLFGLIGGAFIYIVIHDALDPRKERPVGFISGATAFLILITLI
jgi:hypothetical protein